MHMTESTQSYQLKYLAQLIWLQTCQIRGGSERGRNKRVRSCTYSPVLCESHHPAFAFVIYIILWKRKSKRLPRSGVVPWQKGGSNPSSQVSPGQRPSITAHQVPLAQRPHISSHCSPYLPSTHSATQVDSCLWRLFAIEEKKEEEGEEERKKERKKERISYTFDKPSSVMRMLSDRQRVFKWLVTSDFAINEALLAGAFSLNKKNGTSQKDCQWTI